MSRTEPSQRILLKQLLRDEKVGEAVWEGESHEGLRLLEKPSEKSSGATFYFPNKQFGEKKIVECDDTLVARAVFEEEEAQKIESHAQKIEEVAFEVSSDEALLEKDAQTQIYLAICFFFFLTERESIDIDDIYNEVVGRESNWSQWDSAVCKIFDEVNGTSFFAKLEEDESMIESLREYITIATIEMFYERRELGLSDGSYTERQPTQDELRYDQELEEVLIGLKSQRAEILSESEIKALSESRLGAEDVAVEMEPGFVSCDDESFDVEDWEEQYPVRMQNAELDAFDQRFMECLVTLKPKTLSSDRDFYAEAEAYSTFDEDWA